MVAISISLYAPCGLDADSSVRPSAAAELGLVSTDVVISDLSPISPNTTLGEHRRSSAVTRAGFILGPAVVVTLVAAAALWSGHIAVVQDGWVEHTLQVRLDLAAVSQRLTDAEAGERGYIITGDRHFLAPFEGAAGDVDRGLSDLRAFTIDNPVQTPRIDSLAHVVARTFTWLDAAITLRRDRGAVAADAVVQTGTGPVLMDSARALIGRLTDEEDRLLAIRRASTIQQRRTTQIILFAGALIAAAFGIAVNGALAHQREALAERNGRLGELAGELEAQNQELQEQAVELENQNEQLQDQALELEQQSDHVNQQTIELATANEDLRSINEALGAANERLEAARIAAIEAGAVADRARTEAETANAAKATFLATMSHELRTPLNAVTGYVDLLLAEIRGPLTEQQSSDLLRIRRAGTHLMGLINDVLNLAKLETGQVPFSPDVVSLNETLAIACTMIEPQAAAKGVAFNCAPVDRNVNVSGDQDKVLQIVLNLLANAVKFTPEGGRVSLSAGRAPADRTMQITVRDTGRGIPDDQLTRIFEPFVQVGRRLAGAAAGAGLGLAISRELARGMGGEITVTSAEGGGSTFVVTLPELG
jgi:signal transduction histidine kinase